MLTSLKTWVWQLNATYDSLLPLPRSVIMALLLVGIPLLGIKALNASFEDEQAQSIWLVWVLWVLIPRIWYCHSPH